MSTLAALYAAQPAWAWTGVAAALLALEVATGSGYLLWPAACALLTAGAVLLGLPFGLTGQIALFAMLTVVTTIVARRLWPPTPHDPRAEGINDASRRLIGRVGETLHIAPELRVFVDGKEWSAVAEADATPLLGQRVEVVEVLGGARLKVRAF